MTRSSELCSLCNEKRGHHIYLNEGSSQNPLVKFIQQTNPLWNPESTICTGCLQRCRLKFIEHVLLEQKGEISQLESSVINGIGQDSILSQNTNLSIDSQSSLSERLSDRIAAMGGSWKFIIGCCLFLTLWIVVNSYLASPGRRFDPYPFILLNLILSCIAALQAPVILMSQNRKDAKDRLRNEHDYMINLKAELEIRHLHIKMDQLLMHQWQRLLEIQQIQTEMMEEISHKLKAIPEHKDK